VERAFSIFGIDDKFMYSLVKKPERKRPLGRPQHGWED
jgi:hypothetical protein